MKILHINCSDSGSTGKIIDDISRYTYLKGDETVLCVPKITRQHNQEIRKIAVCMPYEQGFYRRLSYITGIPYGFSPLSTLKILNTIKKEKPDIVHLHSINSNIVNVYKLLKFLKRKNIKTVVTNHAEFLYTGNCSHSEECEKWKIGCGNCPMLKKATGSKFFDRTAKAFEKMKKAFEGFSSLSIISVSPWVQERAKQSPIMHNYKHYTIINGVNTEIFNIKDYPSLNNLNKEKTILYVTSLFSDSPLSVKGGKYLIEIAKRFEKDNVKFIIASTKNSINTPLPKNIVLLGHISNQTELAKWYKKVDLTIVTSKRETFGMAVAESLCCGTPVVGFMSGGSESVAIKEFTEFVPFGCVDELENRIRLKWLHFKTKENVFHIGDVAKKKYDAQIMAKEYYDVYNFLN